MCGICGILSIGLQATPPDPALLERMTDTIAHRGPDDRGVWTAGRIGLGNRRLAVIDLSPAGHMPMANEDGSIVITYNGEVYNFRELRERFQLDARGHRFKSRTDTEVLLHLYEELGPAMAEHLNGMFGLAIWDGRTNELHLARDRYGIKPLFYQRDENWLRFGSEIKTILADAAVRRRPDLQALHDYLSFDYIPGPQTAFENIVELAPATWMTVHADGRTSARRYWSPRFEPDESIGEAEAVAAARELTHVAVRRQLIADVPVGVLLSGGLDSSVLVAMMTAERKEPVHTYSVGFEDASFNELPYARMVASEFGAIAREVVITPQIVRDMLPKYLSYIDEPYADGSAIPTYCVCRLARDEVVVVLSGEGGDETFGGYDTYSAYKVSRWFGRIPRWVRHGLMAPIIRRLPVSHKKLSLEFRLKRLIGGQDLPPHEAHLWWRLVLSEARKQELYSPRVREQLHAAAPIRHFERVYSQSSSSDPLSRLMEIDASVFLPDDLMIKNDRMSMAHSLEARVPFTDNDLTDYLARVPSSLKIKGLRKKHLMRTMMKGILPERVLNKKKIGLEMPYSRWLTRELKDLLMRYCAPDRLSSGGLFEPAAVQRLIQEHIDGVHDHGRALWGLLNYLMWMELYLT